MDEIEHLKLIEYTLTFTVSDAGKGEPEEDKTCRIELRIKFG